MIAEIGIGAIEEMIEDVSKYRVQLLETDRHELTDLLEIASKTKNPDPELLTELEQNLETLFDVGLSPLQLGVQ